MRKLCVLTIFSCCCYAASGQNPLVDTLQWQVVQATNQAKGEAFNFSCTFLTKGVNTVDWSQKSGEFVTHYTVTSTDGTWSDFASDGSLVLHITLNEISGQITFAKSAGVVTAHLETNISGVPDHDYLFKISSTTKP